MREGARTTDQPRYPVSHGESNNHAQPAFIYPITFGNAGTAHPNRYAKPNIYT